ncbi:hypothetical protein ThimaDRAFT_4105 [Thiocapsa marina 5811]|uniref:Uncharacterized protein n=1 Tax=Thiocapsa marina 5811 TaxID=768671 RepID=F9UGQ2_9GAMM|nr:hypothetical protein ThimaDRAFT_4105 [Thiocapsa marina 5811]
MNEFPGYGAAHEETMRMFSRTLDRTIAAATRRSRR